MANNFSRKFSKTATANKTSRTAFSREAERVTGTTCYAQDDVPLLSLGSMTIEPMPRQLSATISNQLARPNTDAEKTCPSTSKSRSSMSNLFPQTVIAMIWDFDKPWLRITCKNHCSSILASTAPLSGKPPTPCRRHTRKLAAKMSESMASI